MNNEKILERAKNWFETKATETTYRYEIPNDDCGPIQMTSNFKLRQEDLVIPLIEPKSWVIVHHAYIDNCWIERRENDVPAALVTIEATLLKSEGNAEAEGKKYQEEATYHLRVCYDGDVELRDLILAE
jgi:hypothetical protein